MATVVNEIVLRKLVIQNFLRVEALTVDADGKNVIISGPNESGKTSAIDAIWLALGGKSARPLDAPIHKGAEKASVELDLGKYRVTRKWTAKGTSLVVETADGAVLPSPPERPDRPLPAFL